MGDKNKTLASLAGFARNKVPKASGWCLRRRRWVIRTKHLRA